MGCRRNFAVSAFAGLALAVGLWHPKGTQAALASRQADGSQSTDWSVYNGGSMGQHFSPLTQITPKNVRQLKQAWRTDVGSGGGLQANPLMVGRTLFTYSPTLQVVALDGATGKQLWHAAPAPVCAWGRENCWASQSQAVSAIPGVVFSGGLDGHLRAFGAKDGAVAWDFDTAQTFATVNQGPQGGGSLNLGGATIAGGMLFVNSGYGRFAGQNGHVLLAFAVK